MMMLRPQLLVRGSTDKLSQGNGDYERQLWKDLPVLGKRGKWLQFWELVKASTYIINIADQTFQFKTDIRPLRMEGTHFLTTVLKELKYWRTGFVKGMQAAFRNVELLPGFQ